MNHIALIDDPTCRAVWVEMQHADSWPRFTEAMLDDFIGAYNKISADLAPPHADDLWRELQFQVICSNQKTFSLGGDLEQFVKWIEDQDDASMRRYARKCVNLAVNTSAHYGRPIETIAVVEGDALGGGLECALANRKIIADQDARFGFPEVKFGMFPGMGAISALTRKIGARKTEWLVTTGETIDCEHACALGIVDIMAHQKGDARGAAERYMTNVIGNPGRQAALEAMIQIEEPLPVAELFGIVKRWTHAAMQLSDENIQLVKTIIKAQRREND